MEWTEIAVDTEPLLDLGTSCIMQGGNLARGLEH